jgi:3-methyladenine DNA glycosylase AlkD
MYVKACTALSYGAGEGLAMHPEHQALLAALKAGATAQTHGGFDLKGYHGSAAPVMGVRAPQMRAIAKAWAATHEAGSPGQTLEVVAALIGGASHDEKVLGAVLLACDRKACAAAGPEDIDRWLDSLAGWAQVDSLCQNLFPPERLLADWPAWSGLIRRLAGDPNINKRRAALVLLTGPARRSDDPRLAALAFETIERLKGEKPILITKAVSWLLRALSVRHPREVSAYLERESGSLPAIAVRETRTKLATGRKS